MKTTPKDFFLHLAAVVALYASAIALINLAFSVVNYYNPDVLARYFSVSSIAWPISMLVVLIPVLYVIEWLIGSDLLKAPEKKDLWIRRWRIYLTLFLGGAAIIGDLIVLINWYLNGEITSRFIYKILIVLVVAGAVFAYYLLARLFDSKSAQSWRKVLAWVGIVIVLIAIIGGFTIVGSPSRQRAIRFDNQRVNNLQSIQLQIVNYWQKKQKLPSVLADLNDPISGFTVPTDPETKIDYEYNLQTKDTMAIQNSTGKPSFELCAIFALESQKINSGDNYGNDSSVSMPYPLLTGKTDSWIHGAGHACFERSIDPNLYPPIKVISQPVI